MRPPASPNPKAAASRLRLTKMREAITWLADKFGKDRTLAAALAHTTQVATEIIREYERTREPERTRVRERERSFDGGRMSR